MAVKATGKLACHRTMQSLVIRAGASAGHPSFVASSSWGYFRSCPHISGPLQRGASLEFEGELKRCTILRKSLSMVCDKECLILLHRLRQFLKIGLSELSGQKICPALRMHSILHHPLVVIR